jgi:hypothetical protein
MALFRAAGLEMVYTHRPGLYLVYPLARVILSAGAGPLDRGTSGDPQAVRRREAGGNGREGRACFGLQIC